MGRTTFTRRGFGAAASAWVIAGGAGLVLTAPAPAVAQTAQASTAPTVPPEVAAALPGARLQGSGRLRFLGLRVYDSRLWVGEQSAGPDWLVPLALEIEYLRALDGAQIAERSLEEMRRQATVAADTGARWLSQMKELFPNVREGDRITGVLVPAGAPGAAPAAAARFYVNGRLRGEVRDAEFARLFFGIWLAPQTSQPALREQLLGGARR